MARRPVHVAESALVPLTLATAYERTVVAPLPELFATRHLAFPAVAEVTDQHGTWGSAGPDQTRAIHTADGGILDETLTLVDPPAAFGYHLEPRRGPMKPVIAHVDGRWSFEAVTPAATRVTWSWDIHPRSPLTAPLVHALAATWPAYARTALLTLERMVTIPAA
jgi:hypothetical protein